MVKNTDGTISSRVRGCATLTRVNPLDLVESEHLLDSTSNKKIIARLQRVIFSGNENAKPVYNGVDSRFLILFTKEDLYTDRFVIGSSNQFVFNEEYELQYSFSIMDSIRDILKKDKIDCQ